MESRAAPKTEPPPVEGVSSGLSLERKPNVRHDCPGLQEVRAAKCRQEIVERDNLGQIVDLDGRGDPSSSFPVQQIVRSDPEVKNVARLHAVRIMIVVFLAGLRKRDQLRSDQAAARRNRP